ncbi:mitotic spindle midzone protein [Malassezia pachydermatis]
MLVHDVDVAILSLHTHMTNQHIGLTRAVYGALQTLLQVAEPWSLRQALTLVRLCAPPAWERMADTPEAEALLRGMVHVVRHHRGATVQEHDAPTVMWDRMVRHHGLEAVSPSVQCKALDLLPWLHEHDAAPPLSTLTPVLVQCLQQADVTVRRAAKTAIEAMYGSASAEAKTQMRAALAEASVHHTVSEEIGRVLFGAPPAELTSLPDDVKPVYIHSRFDIDLVFQAATKAFEGRETESNWQAREKAVVSVRGMLLATVPDEFALGFVAQIRAWQEGILKAVASLRTTLSMHAISLVRQLALAYGTQLEHTMDAFFTSLLRMAGVTKKLVAQASQLGVSTILACVPMRASYWQQLQAALQDKSVATRVYVCKHLGVILQVHGLKRASLESHHGLATLLACMSKALCDPSIEVRTAARDVFHTLSELYPSDAEALVQSLPPTARKQMATSIRGMSASPAPRRPPSRTGPSRAVLAAKRAAMAQSPMAERRRMPRESVWHPSLVDGPDASTDLMEADRPWHDAHPPRPSMGTSSEEVSTTLPPLRPSTDTPKARRISSPTRTHARLSLPPTSTAWFLSRFEECASNPPTVEKDACLAALAAHTMEEAHWSSLVAYLADPPTDVAAWLPGLAAYLHSDTPITLGILSVLYRLAGYVTDASTTTEDNETQWLSLVYQAGCASSEPGTLTQGGAYAMLDVWCKHTDACTIYTKLDEASLGYEHPTCYLLTLFALEHSLPHIPRDALVTTLTPTVPMTFKALRHSATNVRRACVSTMVQAYVCMQDRDAWVHLYAPLTEQEARLLEHYIERSKTL